MSEEKAQLLERVHAGELFMAAELVKALTVEVQLYQARTAQEKVVLEAGWEPFEVPYNMQLGFVTRPNRTRRPLILWLSAIVSSFAIAWGLHELTVRTGDPAPIMVTLLVFPLLGAIFTGVFALSVVWTPLGSRWRAQDPLDPWVYFRFNGTPQTSRQCYYASAMPAHTYQRYLTDKHLFDQVYIGSTNRDLFMVDEVRVARLGDPFLLGRIGRKFYLGAQWDLSQDLPPA